jgi:hypothetical protein
MAGFCICAGEPPILPAAMSDLRQRNAPPRAILICTSFFVQHRSFDMAIYELRTYTAIVGKLAEVVELYKTQGWPALQKHPQKLVGYFTGDIGAVNQLIHVWKFDDDADRRAFWAGVFNDPEFMAFAKQTRPLLLSQENKLMLNAPWGPQP